MDDPFTDLHKTPWTDYVRSDRLSIDQYPQAFQQKAMKAQDIFEGDWKYIPLLRPHARRYFRLLDEDRPTCDRAMDHLMMLAETLQYRKKNNDEKPLVVTGFCEIKNYYTVWRAIGECGIIPSEIVIGEDGGVHSLAEQWANSHDVNITRFPADPMQMVDYAHNNLGGFVVVWTEDDGTAEVLNALKEKNLPGYVVNPELNADKFI
jgi:hypothetical protein